MKFIESVEELLGHYGTPASMAIRKVARKMTPEYRDWIERARFCVLSTVGPEGTDGSPRGDVDPVALEIDEQTLAIPDWRGNNRLDSLRNIVRDPRVSVMFMVPGSNTVVRINGTAKLTADLAMRGRFEQSGKQPATVILIAISEIYTQCARAVIRADLWNGEDQSKGLPTVGQILAAMTDGEEGGDAYDQGWAARAAKSMW